LLKSYYGQNVDLHCLKISNNAGQHFVHNNFLTNVQKV